MEHIVYEHLKQSKTIISSLQNKLEETKQQTQSWMHYMKRLEQVVMFTCNEILEVGVTLDMLPKARVIRMEEVDTDFHQRIAELESNLLPITHP